MNSRGPLLAQLGDVHHGSIRHSAAWATRMETRRGEFQVKVKIKPRGATPREQQRSAARSRQARRPATIRAPCGPRGADGPDRPSEFRGTTPLQKVQHRSRSRRGCLMGTSETRSPEILGCYGRQEANRAFPCERLGIPPGNRWLCTRRLPCFAVPLTKYYDENRSAARRACPDLLACPLSL
jgi:hypothetical protein